MKETRVYLVEGTVNHVREEGLYEAKSPQQACYRFCRDRGIGVEEDVPGLSATRFNDIKGTSVFRAKNNGYLDD